MTDDSKKCSIRTQVDEAIDESFPASDPPSWMPKSTTRMDDEELTVEERERLADNEDEADLKIAQEQKAQEEARWLEEKEDLDKKKADPEAVPAGMRDPAVAPLGTDQEAGPATSSPLDVRKRGKKVEESRRDANL